MEGGVDKDIMGPERDQEHILTPQNQLRDPWVGGLSSCKIPANPSTDLFQVPTSDL